MSAILGGLGAACCWAATAFFARTAARVVGGWTTFAWASLIGALLVLGPLTIALAAEPPSAGTLALLALAGALNVGGLVAEFVALRTGKVSVIIPIVSAEGAVAALVAGVAGEPIAAAAWAFLAIVVVGVVATSTGDDPTQDAAGADHARRTVLLSVGSSVLFGVSLYLQGTVSDRLPIGTVIAPPTIMGVLLVVVPLAATRRLRSPRAALPAIAGVAVAELLGFSCYVYGARDSVAIAAVLSSQFAAIAVLVSVVVLRERPAPRQLFGLVAIGAGVTALALVH
jgi:drug/metabolite transporter (DMT)-like permease